MAMPVLIINGQNADIYRGGGGGKYAAELYQRLASNLMSCDLPECKIEFINFSTNECQVENTARTTRTPLTPVKEYAKRCLPSHTFETLCRVYEAFFWKMEEQKTANTVPLSRDHGNRIVLHELTSYTSCGELARICLSPNNRLLVSFLDVQDYYYPENFTDESLTLRRLHYSFYKDRGDLFIAISEFTKQTMIEKLGIDGSKIIVTHLAADDCQKVRPSLDAVEWAQAFGRFLIYPAKAWPHKNHAFLFRTMSHRRDKLRKAGIQLLLTGGFYPVDEQLLGELIKQNDIQDLVQVLGFLTNDQLNALLSKAEYLIFPSLFEGFGMPVLEAMSLGCPVMSSTSASLPEVGGDAAIYFDPANEESLISLLDDMTNGNIDRQSYIEKGFMNCNRFSWETTYRKTIMAYRELLL